jgi:PhoPQ-activated pathogenicity-related protein
MKHLNILIISGSIAINICQIPNQPTVFVADPKQKRRYEDAVIAWTWKTFIENPNDPTILLRLPMTKAVVKAMDTAVEFAAKNGFGNIQKFMVAGESKRGWTTWTTAAVDKRVFAAAPMVMVKHY